jgi:preprotein translocase subunit SecY
MPVILVSSLFMDIYFVSQILWTHFNAAGGNFLVNLLGTFNQTSNQPTGGLAYYVTSPQNLTQFNSDPLRGFIYAGLLIILCVVFSLIWVELGGLGASAVAKQLVDSGMQVPGYRRSVKPIQEI